MEEIYNASIKRIVSFRDEQDWQQLHAPKNVVDVISIEIDRNW